MILAVLLACSGGSGAPEQSDSGVLHLGDGYQYVDATAEFICALATDGTVDCWGWGAISCVRPTLKDARAIGVSYNAVCALDGEGHFACEHLGTTIQRVEGAVSGTFAQLDVKAGNACVLDSSGRVRCAEPACGVEAPTDEIFDSLSVGFDYACGVRPDGSLLCWGAYPGGPCGAEDDMGCSCGGSRADLELAGSFRRVAAGQSFLCTESEDGDVQCLDRLLDGPAILLPSESVAASSADQFACGIGVDGKAVCWGRRGLSQAALDAPDREFVSVAPAELTACGVTREGELVCWGSYLKQIRSCE